jgi:ABC-type transport system involved in multi-copper enzyme maturation permease subunit
MKMTSGAKAGWRDPFAAAGRVFRVFFALGRKARRTRVFFALSFLPVAVSLVLKFNQLFSEQSSFEGAYFFSNIIMVFYLQLIILLLALFFGTSVCSEEVEGRTLPYLITRPVPKPAVVLGKYLAYTLLNIGMVALGLLFSFTILNLDRLADASLYLVLLRYGGVLSLGIIAYAAFFTFLGSFLKRSIFFGLLFSFGWENVIQYFPGSTQRFAIAHYLKSFLPGPSPGRFSFLTFRLEATRPGLALLMLFLITAGFLALACLLFSKKEYLFED